MRRLMTSPRFRRYAPLAIVPVLALALIGGCTGDGADDDNRTSAVSQRQAVFDQAEHLFPVLEPQNFPMREALIEFTTRQDRLGAVYYIYLVDMNGQPYAYFTGQTYPINTCNFLSSSEQVVVKSDSPLIVTAPSLDGMFYGGGGAAAGCNSYFFFDSATDALHVFQAQNYFVSDQPLALDVPEWEVETP